MDLTKEYNNQKLERKRQKLLRDADSARVLVKLKNRQSSVKDSIRIGLGDGLKLTENRLAVSIRHALGTILPAYRDSFRELLLVVEKETDLLEDPDKFVKPLSSLASWALFWVQQPASWKSKSYNQLRSFSSLARHLLARYDVPMFMDHCWFDEPQYQEWFVHIGQGQNIRKIENLPIALTKMQAHHFLRAPKDYTIKEALRWGQIVGMGGEERLVDAVITTHMGRAFHRDEPFWATVLQWFVNNQTMDMRQVGPVIDYIESQKFHNLGNVWVNGRFEMHGPPQPNFSMKGRTSESLIRQVEEWHKHLAKSKSRRVTSWNSCGIEGLDRVEGDGKKRFLIVELLTSAQLSAEGNAMHHCVGSYSMSCSSGRCAIYSLQSDESGFLTRRLTIEVDLQTRQIVQARGKYNVMPSETDKRVLRMWAVQSGLGIGRFTRL